MYEYVALNERKSSFEQLPSEAMLLDGVPLEEQLDGYRTLSVSGREIMKQDIETVRRTGNGSIFLRSSYPSRVITVRYELKATDNAQFRELYNRLNKLLKGSQRELRFVDEPEFAFYGTFSDASDVPPGVNTVIGDFSFFCADPFKYANKRTLTGTDTITFAIDDTYQTLPDRITVTPNASTATITVQTGDKELKLEQGSFLANKPVTFDFIQQAVWNENGDMMEKLALSSDFEEFYIQSGTPITFVQGGNISVTVREVAL